MCLKTIDAQRVVSFNKMSILNYYNDVFGAYARHRTRTALL